MLSRHASNVARVMGGAPTYSRPKTRVYYHKKQPSSEALALSSSNESPTTPESPSSGTTSQTPRTTPRTTPRGDSGRDHQGDGRTSRGASVSGNSASEVVMGVQPDVCVVQPQNKTTTNVYVWVNDEPPADVARPGNTDHLPVGTPLHTVSSRGECM